MKKLFTLLLLFVSPVLFPLRAEKPATPPLDPYAVIGEKLAQAIPKAPEGKLSARYVAEKDTVHLQVPRFTYAGPNGETVELTGAIHIADRAFYEKLNEHFRTFDAVLFELVAGPEKLEALRKKQAPPPSTDDKPNPLNEVFRTLSKDILKLPFQTEVVDYGAANFVHADVSDTELEALFKEKNLDMAKVLSGGAGVGQVRLVLGLIKLLTPSDDPHAMKRVFAPLFGSLGAGFADQKDAEEIIVTRRNDRAMQVLDRELAAGKKHLSLFYGSAHLADFAKRLEKRGWKKTAESWEDAWVFPVAR
jgi:hypothetical protein